MGFLERFERQIRVHAIGEAGQRRLRGSSVLIVGCGALGNNMASLLARAGVGRIAVCDPDVVELSNLPRQTLFFEDDIGKGKAELTVQRLKRIDADIELLAYPQRFDASTAELIARGADVILDATDNIDARYAINEFAVERGLPWVFAGVAATGGLVMPVVCGGPCFECIYPRGCAPELVLNTSEYGVLNTAPAFAATIASTIAMKLLLGDEVVPRLISFDVWDQVFESFDVARDANCRVCGGSDDKGNHEK